MRERRLLEAGAVEQSRVGERYTPRELGLEEVGSRKELRLGKVGVPSERRLGEDGGQGKPGLRETALADEWVEQRQQCVDVLCGYMRLPPRQIDEGEEQVTWGTPSPIA